MVFHKSMQDRTLVVLLGGGEKDLNLMYDRMDKQVRSVWYYNYSNIYRTTKRTEWKNINEAGQTTFL